MRNGIAAFCAYNSLELHSAVCMAPVFRSIIYDHLSMLMFLFSLSTALAILFHMTVHLEFSLFYAALFLICLSSSAISIYFIRSVCVRICMQSQIVYAIKKLRVLPLNDSFHWLCIQIIFICL